MSDVIDHDPFAFSGDRDSRDMGLSSHYEAEMVQLIKQLRVQYSSPNAKFVTASLGQTKQGASTGSRRSSCLARALCPGHLCPPRPSRCPSPFPPNPGALNPEPCDTCPVRQPPPSPPAPIASRQARPTAAG